MSLRSIRVFVAVLAGAALAWPSAAGAAVSTTNPSAAVSTANPLQPGFPQPSVSIPTTTTAVPTVGTTATAGSGSAFSGSSAIIIAIGAIVVLGGISFFIWRDARRRAPVRDRAALADGPGSRQGSKPRAKPRKLSPQERRRRKRGRAR